ncbi:hypothetical protein [Sphingobium sp. LMC3-1-1.1]|uniref:hypothetical protein n=1 Tax=Sphingobium sp. LMC3-1-1.1 TaxID=3135241 RepID=UPI00342E5016
MPNWCENRVRLVAPTVDAAVEFESAFRAGNMMNAYLPVVVDNTPSPNGLPTWYVDRMSQWGVKWDIDPSSGYIERKGGYIYIEFDSAWQPPITFYEYLNESGWAVEAYYFECGMVFGGYYIDGTADSWSYQGGILSLDCFPTYLRKSFGDEAFNWFFEDDEPED